LRAGGGLSCQDPRGGGTNGAISAAAARTPAKSNMAAVPHEARRPARLETRKSFLVLFFKKEWRFLPTRRKRVHIAAYGRFLKCGRSWKRVEH